MQKKGETRLTMPKKGSIIAIKLDIISDYIYGGHLMTKMNSAVENMQFKIKEIRTLFGVSVTKFSLMMGVTRQTVYNIENFKTQLAQVQFLAICTLLNNLLEEYPEKENALIAIWERDFDKIKRRHNNRGLIF